MPLAICCTFLDFLVDRFHWLQNDVWCSKAMNPDSFKSMDSQITSASEERSAASRRLRIFLRLLKQRNFISFTVYQQAVGNVIAMHRDATDDPNEAVTDFWPRWYRKKIFNVAVPNSCGEWMTEKGTDRSAAVPEDSEDVVDGTDADTGGGQGRDAAA